MQQPLPDDQPLSDHQIVLPKEANTPPFWNAMNRCNAAFTTEIGQPLSITGKDGSQIRLVGGKNNSFGFSDSAETTAESIQLKTKKIVELVREHGSMQACEVSLALAIALEEQGLEVHLSDDYMHPFAVGSMSRDGISRDNFDPKTATTHAAYIGPKNEARNITKSFGLADALVDVLDESEAIEGQRGKTAEETKAALAADLAKRFCVVQRKDRTICISGHAHWQLSRKLNDRGTSIDGLLLSAIQKIKYNSPAYQKSEVIIGMDHNNSMSEKNTRSEDLKPTSLHYNGEWTNLQAILHIPTDTSSITDLSGDVLDVGIEAYYKKHMEGKPDVQLKVSAQAYKKIEELMEAKGDEPIITHTEPGDKENTPYSVVINTKTRTGTHYFHVKFPNGENHCVKRPFELDKDNKVARMPSTVITPAEAAAECAEAETTPQAATAASSAPSIFNAAAATAAAAAAGGGGGTAPR